MKLNAMRFPIGTGTLALALCKQNENLSATVIDTSDAMAHAVRAKASALGDVRRLQALHIDEKANTAVNKFEALESVLSTLDKFDALSCCFVVKLKACCHCFFSY